MIVLRLMDNANIDDPATGEALVNPSGEAKVLGWDSVDQSPGFE